MRSTEYRITFGFALCCGAITVRQEFDFQKIKLIASSAESVG
jgi:hypothetical protein